MKKILTIMFAVMFTMNAFAQGKFGPDSAECVKYLSYYLEYVKHNNMEEAFGPWRNAYSLCPVTASQNMLIDGQKLMRWAYKKTKDAKTRQGYLDTLMMLYDQRVATYPKNAVSAYNNKAIDINNFRWKEKEPQAVYDAYKEIFEATGSAASRRRERNIIGLLRIMFSPRVVSLAGRSASLCSWRRVSSLG